MDFVLLIILILILFFIFGSLLLTISRGDVSFSIVGVRIREGFCRFICRVFLPSFGGYGHLSSCFRSLCLSVCGTWVALCLYGRGCGMNWQIFEVSGLLLPICSLDELRLVVSGCAACEFVGLNNRRPFSLWICGSSFPLISFAY